ncbi:thioredoxin 1 [Parabacteroides sp. PFB2-12]|uniref:thioredoxin n=1 Tax=unclassified Parabacteroides TaxID=2649774 RepID=UPI002474C8AF|nr:MULTISPECIES: thioredoxin [unclassified Parabacteroides]MDH6343992.1 thioredoxin 1 [Parabacteroides sp. PM6-13]MDH6391852.1 thioredoxin 1 [Parabacteroides sp. PFB2-12]
MNNVKSLFFVMVLLISVSCTLSAKTGDNSAEKAKTGEVIVLNKADFIAKVFNFEKNTDNWVYEGDKPCIIDFYADWCPPCKKIAPILAELAAEYKEDIIIYKINVDNEKELAALFGIQSIPSLLFVPVSGQPMMAQGALPKDKFIEQIDSFLLNK